MFSGAVGSTTLQHTAATSGLVRASAGAGCLWQAALALRIPLSPREPAAPPDAVAPERLGDAVNKGRAREAVAAVLQGAVQASGSSGGSGPEVSTSEASGSGLSSGEEDAAPEQAQLPRAATRARGRAALGGTRRGLAHPEAAERETLEASGSREPGCEGSGDDAAAPAHKKARRAASGVKGGAAAGGACGRAPRPKAAKRQNFVRMSRKVLSSAC